MPLCCEFASHSPTAFILRVFRVRCERLMESKSWSGMRCFLFYFFFDLRCRLTLCLNAAIHKYTHKYHTL